MENYNPYQAPNSDLDDYDDDYDIPPLYNPKAAMWWSVLLFTPFGAWLHYKNWSALGEEELAKQNFWFAIGSLGLIYLAILIEMLTGYQLPRASISIVPLIAWYQTLGKKQVELLNIEWEGNYERRSMLIAVLVAIFGVGTLLVFSIFVLEFIFGAMELLHPKWLAE